MFFRRYLLSKWPNENQQQEGRQKFAVAGLHKASNGGCVRAVGLYKGCGVKSGGVKKKLPSLHFIRPLKTLCG
jgi:hypothetical protein